MKRKTILITGGGQGIGRAIALRFAEMGFHVLSCGRNKERLRGLEAEITKIGGTSWTRVCDVRDKKAVNIFVNDALKANGATIDVLVNNAGIFTPGQIHLEKDGVYEEMMETNVNGTYFFCRSVIPAMLNSEMPHIFNICSTASIVPYENGGSYCISKYAQYGLTKVLREELKSKNIKVTAVLPGPTFTDSWRGTDLPEDRFLKPEVVGNAVYNAYDTGQGAVVEDLLIRPMMGDIT